jgi:hypothetical protein
LGGINPDAVNWMWRMQGGFGRVVWFPTFDADNHVKRPANVLGDYVGSCSVVMVELRPLQTILR